MQQFLMTVHETWCQILGSSGKAMGLEFYQYPHLVNYVVFSIFVNLEQMADWRLRYVIKTFFKNFIVSVPSEYEESVILPLVNHLSPFSKLFKIFCS